jgi:hypothetical protein
LTRRARFSTEPPRAQAQDEHVDAVAILLAAVTFAILLALVAGVDRV